MEKRSHGINTVPCYPTLNSTSFTHHLAPDKEVIPKGETKIILL